MWYFLSHILYVYLCIYITPYIHIYVYIYAYIYIYIYILWNETIHKVCLNINNEPTHKVITRFQKENLLNKNFSEEPKTENPKTLHFYLKTKVHNVGNPQRPVISSINCGTSKISEYVDYHLLPIVK